MFRPVLTALCVCVKASQTTTDINQFRKCHSASLIRLFVLVMRFFCRFIWSAATDLKSLTHPQPVCFIICLFHLFVQYGGQTYWLYDRYIVQVNWFTFVHFALLQWDYSGSVILNHLAFTMNECEKHYIYFEIIMSVSILLEWHYHQSHNDAIRFTDFI